LAEGRVAKLKKSLTGKLNFWQSLNLKIWKGVTLKIEKSQEGKVENLGNS